MTNTRQLTREEFEARVARFGELSTIVDEYVERTGVNAEAYKFTAADDIYYILGKPNEANEAATKPALSGPAGASLYVLTSPPGDGPALHAHMNTWESFMVLSGSWRFFAGDNEENTAVLKPFDMFSCPPGVSRRFENLSDTPSQLMVIIQGDQEALGDLALPTDVGESIEEKWGPEARQDLERIGMRFDVERAPLAVD